MADWAGAVSAAVAAIGLIFAGWQLSLLNRQARDDRRVAETGVVVSWRAVVAPDHAGEDGLAEWEYEVTAQNPGRLPIDHVEIWDRAAWKKQIEEVEGSVELVAERLAAKQD